MSKEEFFYRVEIQIRKPWAEVGHAEVTRR